MAMGGSSICHVSLLDLMRLAPRCSALILHLAHCGAGLMPDFCLLVVGANMGVQRMTKEHISIACALQVRT